MKINFFKCGLAMFMLMLLLTMDLLLNDTKMSQHDKVVTDMIITLFVLSFFD